MSAATDVGSESVLEALPIGLIEVHGVRLISVQEVTVHARPQSEHWRGVRSAPSRKCLSGNEFLLVLQSAVERLFVGSISAGGACFRRGL